MGLVCVMMERVILWQKAPHVAFTVSTLTATHLHFIDEPLSPLYNQLLKDAFADGVERN